MGDQTIKMTDELAGRISQQVRNRHDTSLDETLKQTC